MVLNITREKLFLLFCTVMFYFNIKNLLYSFLWSEYKIIAIIYNSMHKYYILKKKRDKTIRF